MSLYMDASGVVSRLRVVASTDLILISRAMSSSLRRVAGRTDIRISVISNFFISVVISCVQKYRSGL